MASFYTEQQSVDVREGQARRVKEGWFVGLAPYGYRNVRKDSRGVVEVDPEAAANVKRIFQLYAYENLTLDGVVERINAALAGLTARTSVHVCFGNNAGRPMAPRGHARLLPAIERLACRQLMLEFANREMAEVEMLARLAERFEIAAGVVDVKNYHVETAAEVAERIARVRRHVPAARLTITADCGYSALPRYLARAKMRAMAAGAALARRA